jgi:hypothetical protein
MNISSPYVLLPIAAIIFFGVILWTTLTKNGRKAYAKIYFGTIIKDYGDLGSTMLNGADQNFHLYEFSKNEENFFVLEVSFLASVSYVKISKEVARNFIKVISSVKK